MAPEWRFRMKEIVLAVTMVLLIAASLCLYTMLMAKVFPKYIIKRRYVIKEHLGRGLKKFLALEGRAVVYEPHPSIRKYIRKFSLTAQNGYKYLECSIDSMVDKIRYTVMMMNNKNELIDALDVQDYTKDSVITHPIYLHPDTSYVAIAVQSVNDVVLSDVDISYYSFKDIGFYAAAASVLSFFELLLFSYCANVVTFGADGAESLGLSIIPVLLYSVLIGAASAVIFICHCNKKNVKVTWNDKQ